MGAQLLDAAVTCQHRNLAVKLYGRLTRDSSAAGFCTPQVHAAGVSAYLAEAVVAAHSRNRSHASSTALASALAVLEAHAEALLGCADASLADTLLNAAAEILRASSSFAAEEQQPGYSAALLAFAGSGQSAAQREQLYAALLPPARLAVWGLRLTAARKARNSVKTSDLPSKLHWAAEEVSCLGINQLLLFLHLCGPTGCRCQPPLGKPHYRLRCRQALCRPLIRARISCRQRRRWRMCVDSCRQTTPAGCHD